jgi:hypoxanthine-DNA glycosylase
MIVGFPPVADARSRVLILGSMPSEASLAKGQYYAHPRNAFWPLMSALLGEPQRSDYAARLDMLLRHGVALWDVAAACEREGSGDAAIRDVIVNDFPAFFAAHPAIRRVYFNGGKAWALYRQHVLPTVDGYVCERLGSTSPAHVISFEARLMDWRRLTDYLREEA